MKLYQISADMRRALHELEIAEADGNAESYERAMQALNAIDQSRDEKLGNCCAYYRELESDVAALKAELERLSDALHAAEKRRDSWKAYIAACIGAGESWKNAVFKLSWRKSTAVKIENEELIPSIYMREHLSYEPDKKQIAADLKTGATIPGVVLEQRESLQIS